MAVLPDVATHGLDALFVGTAVGDCQALAGHHHATRGDAFWSLLHASGLTPRLLRPDEEDLLPAYGLGVVDLLPEPGHERPPVRFDVARLVAKVEALRPSWVVLTSKRTADVVARALGERPAGLGEASWLLGGSSVFVVPSPSPANQRRDYDGRPRRVDWWADCARAVRARP
uniref:G:T/U mismatch-specific uracil/thymine DNA-glycosylase n=1 Tax=uncultured Nocardioidaceae bacterium TaxID=253824 RepID=A0A6J4M5I7_9ACTN|nr:MAG: G:T/U mismatch-specific uracil/thymine DNA-glycosylase [uncultured Nocardioidaceae bacterium]